MAGDYYSRISARFWIDTKGWGGRNQLVALYLLTNTHSTMEGLYHLPLGYLCADLSLTVKQAAAALAFIERAGVVSYDPDAEVVFVRKALKHGAPKTKNHITGAVNRLRSVPPSPLWDEFLVACRCHASGLVDAIHKAQATPLASSSSNSSSKPYPDPSQGEGDTTTCLPVHPNGKRGRDKLRFDADVRRMPPLASRISLSLIAARWCRRRCVALCSRRRMRASRRTSGTGCSPNRTRREEQRRESN